MTYSKYFMPSQSKIPTPLSIAAILLIIFLLIRFFSSNPIPSKASKKVLRQLNIVNPTSTQIGIFWQTDEKETGWVVYGQNEGRLDNTAPDEKDLQDKRDVYYYHYAVLKNLQPDSFYFYKIVSNNQLVEEASGKAFSFKTPTELSTNSNANPAYGKVIKANGEALENATVLLFFKQAYPLLTLTKTTGEWLVPLNLILNKDTMKSQTIDLKDKVRIEIYSEEKEKSEIIADVSQISPLPQTVILGKDYNFSAGENVLSAASTTKALKPNKIEILFPREGALIPGGSPLIKGTAIAGNEVVVVINSAKSYAFKTTVEADGTWKVLLDQQLSPGEHTLKITTKDAEGKSVTLTRSFVMTKSGEQVLGQATAEATPTFTPVPTATPFLSLTIAYSPYPTQQPTVTITPPTSGTDITAFGVASTSLIILGLGILLAF